MAVEHQLSAKAEGNQRHLIVQRGSRFCIEENPNLTRLMRHVELPPIVSRTFSVPSELNRLVAGSTSAEATRALDNLLLGNGDDVDVDGVEL